MNTIKNLGATMYRDKHDGYFFDEEWVKHATSAEVSTVEEVTVRTPTQEKLLIKYVWEAAFQAGLVHADCELSNECCDETLEDFLLRNI